MPQLILASTSRYRAQALERLGFACEQIDPRVEETERPGEAPQVRAVRLAVAKASAISEQLPEAIVIGSDQVGWCNNQLLHKPGGREQAMAQLRSAAGTAATFFTAVAVRQGRASACATLTYVDQTQLMFRRLNEGQIAAYVDADKPYDCAGAFKIEGRGISLFEQVHSSDPSALIGLPLIGLTRILQQFGVDPLTPSGPATSA